MREALAPLEASASFAAPGQVSGMWFQGQTSLGSMPAGIPLELFGRDALTPDTRHQTPLLQVFNTYILFQTDQGVAIVDQHSAHERVLYEDVMRQLSGDGAPAQRLLLPLTLDFAPAELDAIDAHRELLERVGFEIEPFSGRSIVASISVKTTWSVSASGAASAFVHSGAVPALVDKPRRHALR